MRGIREKGDTYFADSFESGAFALMRRRFDNRADWTKWNAPWGCASR